MLLIYLPILRFGDSVCSMENCLFMNQIEQNGNIAKSFSKLQCCHSNNHNHQTRSATWKLLDTPCFSTNFGMTHIQPNIIVSSIGAILKNNSPW